MMRLDLATCYGQERLPRYTSYPTAPHFSPAVSGTTYADWLARLPANTSVSLYLHIPFCRAMCWYCGCHTTIARHEAPVTAYVAALRREIELVTERIGRKLAVDHIHFGGGTPTILPPEQLTGLTDALRSSFAIRPGAEIAIEIDPRTLTPTMSGALATAGVNRASLGIQSFDPAVQRAINRVQDSEETAWAVDSLRHAGIAAINFDLIYGLPYQDVASCLETVRQAVRLRPDRFSVFGYAHVPSFKKHQRKIADTSLPDSPERYRQSLAIADALTANGYCQIGLDHFALPDDMMTVAAREGRLHRNFQGYTTDRSEVLLGFGASAIGRLPQGYVQNETATRAYAEGIAAGSLATIKGYRLDDDDHFRAEIIERIMCDFSVDLGPICARHGTSPETVLSTAPRLGDLIANGVVERSETVLSVPEHARFLVRSVAAAFDAYLDAAPQRHSRAV